MPGAMKEDDAQREGWYRRAFGELYLLVYSHRNEDLAQREIDFLLQKLNLPTGSWVLDLCCGSGRHLRFLRKAGLCAVGLDLSSALLSEAASKRGLRGALVRGDMRHLPFERTFKCVLNLFSSFGYFASDRENERALREMVRVLEPGGWLVVDHINRPYLERTLVPRSEEEFPEGRLVQERRISGKRVEKEITWIRKGEEPLHVHESVRVYTRTELEELLQRFGLEVKWWWGGFEAQPLAAHSPRMIAVARKPCASQ